ncbi:hypothetical protein NFI96_023145 [Prochilodus magdalenae]|nr:hypothetical protein NFI96_023145 [Prochilodus magdalenae]
MGNTFYLRRNVYCCFFILAWNTIEAQIRYTIPEELREGSVVGNIAKDLGLDLSEVVDRKLRIASGSGKQYFSVSVAQGELIVNEKIDRESLCGQSVPCLLPLEAVVENPLQLHRIEIEIQDINDNTPNFSSNERTLNIPESINPGAKFLLDSADDPDIEPVSIQPLRIGTMGPLDREKYPEYKIRLNAIDAGSPPRSTHKDVTITVSDVNDNPPVFSQRSYTVYIKENSAHSSVLCSVSAHDPDLDQNAKISYSVLDSKVQDVPISSYVYINSENGSIFSMHSFDYERMKVFQIQVQARDHGSPVSLSSKRHSSCVHPGPERQRPRCHLPLCGHGLRLPSEDAPLR